MNLTCNRDDLINNISIVQKAVSSNSTNALLNGILIEASSDN
ncbi:MAG: DNA polymerase III subunit beta, partial [Clostridiales bacterium]|nr:DNA polymerase III subunit beta [Clostridiales bacterium]